jgi:hypothetical protein
MHMTARPPRPGEHVAFFLAFKDGNEGVYAAA